MALQPSSDSGSGGKTKPGRRISRVNILAILAVLSIIVLVDSEIVAYGVPGIVAVADLLHLPTAVAYGAIGVLGLLVLWLSAMMARHIWRVEHQLDAAQKSPAEMTAAC